jgi:uncharacterized protein YjlB
VVALTEEEDEEIPPTEDGVALTEGGVALTEGGEDEEAQSRVGNAVHLHLLTFVVAEGVAEGAATVVVEGSTGGSTEVGEGEALALPDHKAGQYHVLKHVTPKF